jgi:hypothetical protein
MRRLKPATGLLKKKKKKKKKNAIKEESLIILVTSCVGTLFLNTSFKKRQKEG